MYQFSVHSLEQLAKRNITKEIALWVIENTNEKLVEDGVTVYQNIIIENNKAYLTQITQ